MADKRDKVLVAEALEDAARAHSKGQYADLPDIYEGVGRLGVGAEWEVQVALNFLRAWATIGPLGAWSLYVNVQDPAHRIDKESWPELAQIIATRLRDGRTEMPMRVLHHVRLFHHFGKGIE